MALESESESNEEDEVEGSSFVRVVPGIVVPEGMVVLNEIREPGSIVQEVPMVVLLARMDWRMVVLSAIVTSSQM